MVDAYVADFAYALGDIRTNVAESEAAGLLFSTAEDLRSVGFEWHHICRPATTAYELAEAAVSGIPAAVLSAGVDAIIYATCLPANGNIGAPEAWRESRDVANLMEFPASRLQADFSLDGAIVIGLSQQGSTGMLGSLRIASALLGAEPGWERVLCVTADRLPDGARYEHSYHLVSDSAAACVVGTRPTGLRLVTAHQITHGGLYAATNDETVGSYFSYVQLLIKEALRRTDLDIADIDWLVPQNTDDKVWQIMSRVIGIDPARVWQPSLRENGHAISADTIVNLAALLRSGKVRAGDRILLLGAGYGLHWQAVLLESTTDDHTGYRGQP